MGCFSFLSNVSGKAALSTSFDGSPVHLFLLVNGKVREHMFGNYNSYGSVFKGAKSQNSTGTESFEWNTDWHTVCNLMFDEDESSGIAMLHESEFDGTFPTRRSEGDPNQGWGSDEDGEDYFASTESNIFPQVAEPFHHIYDEDGNRV